MSYWDTSCLIKLYTPEPDSATFQAYLAVHPDCVTSEITPLEFWAAVRRKEAEGVLAPGEAKTVGLALDQDVAGGAVRLVTSDHVVKTA